MCDLSLLHFPVFICLSFFCNTLWILCIDGTLILPFRNNCESATEVIASFYKDLHSDKKALKKNIEEALESQRNSLDIASKVASHISFCFKTNEVIINFCTKGS